MHSDVLGPAGVCGASGGVTKEVCVEVVTFDLEGKNMELVVVGNGETAGACLMLVVTHVAMVTLSAD